ncbi:PP16A phosphatase, partial [Bucco capensis]|nr:PP16A phosphatase [Bucco capensis]
LPSVQEFLASGISPDLSNEDGLTALHQCCIDDSGSLVLLLLDAGADVNAQDSELWTPLHAAATCGHLALVQLLIQRGADLLALNSDGNMPYDLCEDEVTLDCLESAMAEQGITQEKIEDARAATERQMLREIQELLQEDADLDAPRGHGATLLHIAAANGYVEAAELLLEHRAGVGSRDEDGWQPLHAAACWGQLQLVELLVAHGADLNSKSLLEETPLDVCADDEVRAKLLELKHKHEVVMKSHQKHKSLLQRRTSSAGSRGPGTQPRGANQPRDSAPGSQSAPGLSPGEPISPGTQPRGANQPRDSAPGSQSAPGVSPRGANQPCGEPQPRSWGAPPPSQCPALSPQEPSLCVPVPPAQRNGSAPAAREQPHHTLADLKRQRAAASKLQRDPGTPPGAAAAVAGAGGSSPEPVVGSMEPPLLRLTAPLEEAPAQKQRCCKVM